MKFTIFLISFLILINIINCFKEAKDFLYEFIKTTTNDINSINLSEQCMGKSFDYHFLLLKKNYKENNFEKLSINLENLAIDIFINCPNFELKKIFNNTEFEGFGELPAKYKSKIYIKSVNFGTTLYMQYKNNTLTGTSLGKVCGQFINLFKNNYTYLNELEIENKNISQNNSVLDSINEYFDIIGGIFIGMKENDDGSESKCYNDILKGKTKIMNNIENSLKKVDGNKEIGDIFKNIIFNLITVEGLFVDCNLLSFASNIISVITSSSEMSKLLAKITNNSSQYILFIGKIAENIKDNNRKEAGKYIGKIISEIFSFHVK